ncbi:DUF192 domain-containing protein [Halostella litorea]|uniref:DUF192 domain-containing protein n=1 Tax=Halostella litorea TaxID=2528831 RepID=UPI0010933142|nr:DUF192 domain-containing protein [Halostella litorea]
MRLVHEPADAEEARDAGDGARTLASDVERADSWLARARGLMFRREVPEDYALYFPFGATKRRGIHTAFVRVPIDVVWLANGTVTRVETLAPWRSVATAEADAVVELAAGGAAGVSAGDAVRLAD